MYSYDKERDILTISKIPVTETQLEYRNSEMYESYIAYLENQLIDDINEFVIKPLDKAVSEGRLLDSYFYLKKKDKKGKKLSYIKKDVTSYQGYENMVVYISLACAEYIDGTTPFVAMKIPYMDKYGILHKDGRKLAVIGSLVQDDDITFDIGKSIDKAELKIVTAGGNYYNIKQSSKMLYMEFSGVKYDVKDVLTALAIRDGLNVDSILLQASKIPSIKSFDEDERNIRKEYSYDRYSLAGSILEKMKDPKYSLHKVREKMNRVLSLDRAVGKTVATTIELDKLGKKIEAGELLTQRMVDECSMCHITSIPVVDIPNLTGCVLAENIYLPYLRKGTELIDEIKRYFPENKGRYLNNSCNLQNKNIILLEGTVLTKSLLHVLAYNGYTSINIRDSIESKAKPRIVYFNVEIISNRSVRPVTVGYLPSSKDIEYVYINEDGSISEETKDILTAYDLLAMISLFDRLSKGQGLEFISNKDLGLRKKVNMVGELFQKPLKDVGFEFVRYIKNTIKSMFDSTSSNLMVYDLNDPVKMEILFSKLSEKWWSRLWKTKVIQSVDSTNPLSFYSSLEKINTITKNSHSITEGMRSLSMGHYGRLCPYEIPSGVKLGTVNNKTPLCKIINGVMLTPYKKVIHIGTKSFVKNEIEYLSVEQEEKFRIADIISLCLGKNGEILNNERVLARIPAENGLEKMSVAYIEPEFVDYVNIDPQQSISLACSIIPFMGADDSARVTFEISMSKQAKALLYAEIPYVLTSAYYDVPRKSPHFMIHAEYNGVVLEAKNTFLVVKYDGIDNPVKYDFKTQEFSNTSIIIRKIEVEEGQRVIAGDILVSSNYTKDGLLAMGTNALVCFIPEGYNYEDGVYASERLKHKLTSYSANIERRPIPEVYDSTTILPANKFEYVKPGHTIYKLKNKKRKASESVYGAVKSEKIQGFIIDIEKVTNKFTQKDENITTCAISFDYMKEGDKIANRHGNKGVVPKLRENTEMPRFMNGEFVDLAYNPAGVSSRMNIGQIKECNLGFVGYILRSKMRSDSFNGASNKDIKDLLTFTYRLANEDDAEKVIADFPQFPLAWRQKRLEYISWIRGWKGAFNVDGTAYMYNPKTGKMFEEPVLVGINYIHKLVQEVDKKLHVRAGYLTERYTRRGSSPTQGAARGGGQRMGEMEIAALSAYGASAYLQEIINDRGDNPVARNNFTVKNALGGTLDYLVNPNTAIRRSTEEFIYKLEALGCVVEFTQDELPNPTIEENERRTVYSKRALLSCCTDKNTISGSEMTLDDFLEKIK